MELKNRADGENGHRKHGFIAIYERKTNKKDL
ncbi:Uncharacterised protein [uncultured Clostridium sp.]|nr:Uncharacterised protein [uncultured Clostridium sp.]